MIDTTTLLEQALSLPEHERAKLAARLSESPDEDVRTTSIRRGPRRSSADARPLNAGNLATSDWKDVRARIEREIFGR